jgi:hypothetical protein
MGSSRLVALLSSAFAITTLAASSMAVLTLGLGAVVIWSGYATHPSVESATFRVDDVLVALACTLASHGIPQLLRRRGARRRRRRAIAEIVFAEARGYRNAPERVEHVTNKACLDHDRRELDRRCAAWGVAFGIGVFFLGLNGLNDMGVSSPHCAHWRPSPWGIGVYFIAGWALVTSHLLWAFRPHSHRVSVTAGSFEAPSRASASS